ncbi:hypothetical protein PSCICE_03110 [Pseudomonas cichorii]|nr:hypothetical protein [Pseudomonas cichorii]GFM49044.1 hypothetical protein PSCICE_03110 [Pseudomonas cichorii]
MTKLKASDLKYKYSWKATEGDNPDLIHEDAKHLSRNEGYEMLPFLNKLGLSAGKIVYDTGKEFTKEALLHIEWMLKEKYKSTAPGRGTVVKWLNDNWDTYRKEGGFAALS